MAASTFDHEKLDCYRLAIDFNAWVGKELLLRIVSTLTKLIERLLASS